MAGFDWKTFIAPFQNATPEELGIPETPCKNCPKAEGKGGCHKPVNPDFSTSCQKWDKWFCEVWQILTARIRGTGR